MGEKLKSILDNAEDKAKKNITKGLETSSEIRYFPDDFTNYLLDLKLSKSLPVSLLPHSLFVKPFFRGKKEYFQRLASELISFGLSYQRVHLKPIRLYQITSLFHKHKPWWECDIQDIEHALNELATNAIVEKTPEGFFFEPLSTSSEVRNFINLISDGVSDYGEISLTLIQQLVAWDHSRINSIINILVENQISIYDKKKKLLFFPGFTRSK